MKEWQRPELTVLVRNKPEEAVLSYCKMMGVEGPPASDDYWECYESSENHCFEEHPS